MSIVEANTGGQESDGGQSTFLLGLLHDSSLEVWRRQAASTFITAFPRKGSSVLSHDLDDFRKLDDFSGGSYLTWGHDSSLLWALSILQGYIEASTSSPDIPLDPTQRCRDELHVYGPRLPESIP